MYNKSYFVLKIMLDHHYFNNNVQNILLLYFAISTLSNMNNY